jgi:phage shock protein A
MGFKNRISILLKSQFNYWVTQAEEPGKIINHAVEEMEDGLDKARAKLSVLKFRVDAGKRFLQRIGGQISYWQKRAEELLKEDMEENAKEAVRRKRILEEEERKLKIKHVEDEVKLKEMETALKELENRVQMAKAKRNILIKDIRLRKGLGEDTKEVEEHRGIDFEEPFSLLRKMEERVEEETEFTYSRQVKEKEALEKEERLISEEVEMLKRNIEKGGSKK